MTSTKDVSGFLSGMSLCSLNDVNEIHQAAYFNVKLEKYVNDCCLHR